MAKINTEKKFLNNNALYMPNITTYGWLTLSRVTENYSLDLNGAELFTAIQNPHSFYHTFMQTPLKNLLTGIIRQQAYDYIVYIQKLFVDYFLFVHKASTPKEVSVETNPLEKELSQVELIDLEIGRQKVFAKELAVKFHTKEEEYSKFIRLSQKTLMNFFKNLKFKIQEASDKLSSMLAKNSIEFKETLIHTLSILLLRYDLSSQELFNINEFSWEQLEKSLEKKLTDKNKLALIDIIKPIEIYISVNYETIEKLIDSAEILRLEFINYRSKLYDTAVKILNNVKLIPNHTSILESNKKNLEGLNFDEHLGETSV